jgi:acyl-CoA thioester hydrolase
MRRATAIGRHWLAYETEIEYFHSLRYGNEVAVKTWVENFRRVRSLRRYDIFKGQELAARAGTDWVFMDTKTLRPATIPRHVVDAYSQGKDVSPAPRHESPPPSAPPENVYQLRRRVEWRDVDSAGHVNNAVYLDYVADCDAQVGRAYGWPIARVREAGHNILPRQHHIEYKTPAVLGDELEISTWVSDVGKDSMARHYVIKQASDGQLVARVRAQFQWIGMEIENPCPFPRRIWTISRRISPLDSTTG